MLAFVQANSLNIPLPDKSIHCVVTSPPYWGLRDYGVAGQLGLEPEPDCLGWATGRTCGACYICQMLGVFAEVWRVLRDDGTLWLNLGDTYVGGGRGGNPPESPYQKQRTNGASKGVGVGNRPAGLKPKDMVGIPWRMALALQQQGWYLRSDVIWHKLQPMPESVTDRPTKSHEYIFLLSKSERYFYDTEAVKEATSPNTRPKGSKLSPPKETRPGWSTSVDEVLPTRNLRSVWSLASEPYKGAHFATFPSRLPELAILAGTSAEGVCPACGAPRARLTEVVGYDKQDNSADKRIHHLKTKRGVGATSTFSTGLTAIKGTVGWQPTCDCGEEESVPAVVLDPFNGSGTTGQVAKKHGRGYVGLELNGEYLELARKRTEAIQMSLV